MLENSLNIGGSEWMIIIFVAVVLVLGTGKLPGAAKKMGKIASEYNNAKNEIQEQMKEATEEIPKISGPVETEREKLEMIAKSAGIKTEGTRQMMNFKKKFHQRWVKGQQILLKQNKNYFGFLIRYRFLSNLFLANL